ncbi:MAG TPA: CoA-binding protein [Bacteroidota bacterium]|nr:CoA-binding protein [Bacteroidota bacterium]
MNDVEDFILQTKIAIVGASNDRNKYGNVAYLNLRGKGYTVYPVNPKEQTIEGDKCYASLASLPEKVGGVVIVVPPVVGVRIVQEAYAAGIKRIWFQEGAESDEAVQYCRDHGMSVVTGQCIMVVSNYRNLVGKQ